MDTEGDGVAWESSASIGDEESDAGGELEFREILEGSSNSDIRDFSSSSDPFGVEDGDLRGLPGVTSLSGLFHKKMGGKDEFERVSEDIRTVEPQPTPSLNLEKVRRRPENGRSNAVGVSVDEEGEESISLQKRKRAKRTTVVPVRFEPDAAAMDEFELAHDDFCFICGLPGLMLCCDSCEKTYHLHCLNPPLSRTPQGMWDCPVCLASKSCSVCERKAPELHCEMCLKYYHKECVIPPVSEVPEAKWICVDCLRLKREEKERLDMIFAMRTVKFAIDPMRSGISSPVPIKDSLDVSVRTDLVRSAVALALERIDEVGFRLRREFFVKWAYLSHLHCEWISEERAKRLSKRKVVEFLSIFSPCSESDLRLLWNSPGMTNGVRDRWKSVDRVVAHRIDEGTGDNEYLIKWGELNYEFSTWENEKELRQLLRTDEDVQRFEQEVGKFFARVSLSTTTASSTSVSSPVRLFPFQEAAVSALRSSHDKRTHMIFADEHGLGKTTTIVAFLSSLYTGVIENEAVVQPSLVVVPPASLELWVAEFESWARSRSLNVISYCGSAEALRVVRENEFRRSDGSFMFHVLITTSETVVRSRGGFPLLQHVPWSVAVVVCDVRGRVDLDEVLCNEVRAVTADMRVLVGGIPFQRTMRGLLGALSFVSRNESGVLTSADLLKTAVDEDGFFALAVGQLRDHMLRRTLARELDAAKMAGQCTNPEFLCVDITRVQRERTRRVLQEHAELLRSRQPRPLDLVEVILKLRLICSSSLLLGEEAEEMDEGEAVQLGESLPSSLNGGERSSLDQLMASSGKIQMLDSIITARRHSSKALAESESRPRAVLVIICEQLSLSNLVERYLTLNDVSYVRVGGPLSSERAFESITAPVVLSGPLSGVALAALSVRCGPAAVVDLVVQCDYAWNSKAYRLMSTAVEWLFVPRWMKIEVVTLVSKGSIEDVSVALYDEARAQLRPQVGDVSENAHSEQNLARLIKEGTRFVFGDSPRDDDVPEASLGWDCRYWRRMLLKDGDLSSRGMTKDQSGENEKTTTDYAVNVRCVSGQCEAEDRVAGFSPAERADFCCLAVQYGLSYPGVVEKLYEVRSPSLMNKSVLEMSQFAELLMTWMTSMSVSSGKRDGRPFSAVCPFPALLLRRTLFFTLLRQKLLDQSEWKFEGGEEVSELCGEFSSGWSCQQDRDLCRGILSHGWGNWCAIARDSSPNLFTFLPGMTQSDSANVLETPELAMLVGKFLSYRATVIEDALGIELQSRKENSKFFSALRACRPERPARARRSIRPQISPPVAEKQDRGQGQKQEPHKPAPRHEPKQRPVRKRKSSASPIRLKKVKGEDLAEKKQVTRGSSAAPRLTGAELEEIFEETFRRVGIIGRDRFVHAIREYHPGISYIRAELVAFVARKRRAYGLKDNEIRPAEEGGNPFVEDEGSQSNGSSELESIEYS